MFQVTVVLLAINQKCFFFFSVKWNFFSAVRQLATGKNGCHLIISLG